MKKLAFILLALFALTAPTYGTDIDIGASSIVGFNTANAGVDTALSGVTVTLGSPSVTCSSCLPTGAVGLSGMKVSLGSPGVVYTIASVASRSAFTLTANYGESSGTVGGTLYKFVHLRIYVLSPFIPAGSTTVIQSGAPGTTAWYRRYGVSIINDGAQNVAHVPAIDNLPATTDSSNPTARYYAAFYAQGGGFMQSYPGCVDDFRLSHQTTPTSWAQICTFNSPAASPPPQPINFYTTSQIDARFPSCTLNNLDYFAATGNVKSCLALSAEFSISGGILSLAGPSGVNRVQEEGSNLPQRQTLNFIGSLVTAADDPGNSRTNVTVSPDIVTGPASATDNAIARFDLTTGKIVQNSAVTMADTTGNFSVPNGWIFANAGGSSLAINQTAFELTTAPSSSPTLQAFRLVVGTQTQSSGSALGTAIVPVYNQSGTAGSEDLVLARTETALGSGTHNFIRGSGGAAGNTQRFRINNLGNYFFGASGGFIGDENGNEYLTFTTTPSAVSEVSITNAATGVTGPTIGVSSGEANVNLNVNAKGTGRVVIKGYPFTLESSTAPTGNITTGLDNLHSFTMPAGSLAANGDYVEVNYGGVFATNDNDKRIQINFGGQVVHNTGLFDQDSGTWDYKITYVRASPTAVIATGQFIWNSGTRDGAGTAGGNYVFAAVHVTLTVADLGVNNMVLLVQAEGTATNDIVQDVSTVKLVQR